MSKEFSYKDLVAFHPGSYVEDIIEDLNITQFEFAERVGTSSKTISKIINGEENISVDLANKLAKLTGISIKTWINLQRNYDIKVMEIKNLQDEDEKRACDLTDISYFKQNNFLEDKRYSSKEKISELRKLLNISSLSNLFEFNSAVSYRTTQAFTDRSIVNSNIMLELATDIAKDKTGNSYKKRKLNEVLPIIRKMTLESPDDFYPKLKELLLQCGIVLVGLPNLKNARLQGATKKFKNGSVLLLITDRNKRSDIFWFSLIHELGHIYYEEFYSNYEDHDSYNEKEKRADQFALDFFIPSEYYNDFINAGDFSKDAIMSFSKELNLHPSILVGRMQKDKYIKFSEFNYLKENYGFQLI
ncbi:hypothetical protein GCM10025886_20860 [Tetragenococcus halophilus subsp. flandriensis]|uniref:HigA family addiction module antitoxin n=1 Tax=Tetragenococcus halophilus TaxID=51669 RepID=UPI0023E9ABDB|nr:HigA family addiction module antitoxin [Tetragenococcus halophilus]GMA08935.1 hypothetical protein GCM10025886_20860 [Tetragenococcus halophilus subsp. flandriensis]